MERVGAAQPIEGKRVRTVIIYLTYLVLAVNLVVGVAGWWFQKSFAFVNPCTWGRESIHEVMFFTHVKGSGRDAVSTAEFGVVTGCRCDQIGIGYFSEKVQPRCALSEHGNQYICSD